jgi:hypothetical protein
MRSAVAMLVKHATGTSPGRESAVPEDPVLEPAVLEARAADMKLIKHSGRRPPDRTAESDS